MNSQITPAPAKLRGLSRKACLAISNLFTETPLRKFGFNTETITRFDSMKNYISDRVEQIDDYQQLFKKFCNFEGKTVLEIGCNKGYMLNSFLQHENFTAIGGDIDTNALEYARNKFGDRAKFFQTTPNSIPLESKSADIIYTIDTVEHLSDPKAIFLEALRVLKPGGWFLVHFHPWFGPYGTHLEDIIPYPWANAIFSMDTLLDVAAHLYDHPDYKVPCYFQDEETGEKRPNPYLDRQMWNEYLNQITLRQFRGMLKELPFEVVHNEQIGFGGKVFSVGKYMNAFSQVPVLDEFFTKAYFCVLRKKS
jgi:ubiquinone/menaquinone biosynthesis C-methylase UbiE